MRPQPDLPRRPSRRDRRARRGPRFAGRGRAILGGALVFLFVLLISLRGIASFYTDYLWFQSLDLTSVWRTVLGAKLSLTIIGAVVFFALCWGNLTIAERLAPAFRPSNGEDDLIERYHEIVGRRAGTVRLGLASFLALVVGVSLGGSWNEWILFNNRVDFGQKDATFHTDVGFYVFQLPFLTTVASWLFSGLILVLIVTLMAHVVNGGIRFHTNLDRVTPQVKAHVSVLLGALALVQGGRYWLDRYQLTFSTRGTVDGATYTDHNVQMRVIYLLIAISVFAFGLFIANIWRRGWVLPAMGVGLWLFVAVLAGGIVPAFVQRFRVEPAESSMEAPYIRQNIDATRKSYGLDDVQLKDFAFKGDLDAKGLADNLGTLSNVRLWDPSIMRDSYERQQQRRAFYEINDVDVDRYMIDGELTQVMFAARDLATAGVQQSSWEAKHLAYTHGYGVVGATANTKTSSGDPDLIAKNIPVETADGGPVVKQPGIYFGENKSGYVITNTDRPEIDYQDATTKFKAYAGKDGIRLGSGAGGLVKRAAFALRFGDINPLVSGNIRPESKVLIERDVTARVKSVAPFLAYDADPYLVLLDGKVKYVLDAYTTTRNYPNAQRADTGGLAEGSGLRGRSFNYARNSVKAVVDAYDGTVDLYVVDTKDPIIKAYQKAFPDLFTPVSKAPQELRDHFRYPEDLFTVQTQMWAKYHVKDADTFYNGNDEWQVPRDPGVTTVKNSQATTVGPDGQPLSPNDRYKSQYQLMKLPGEDQESFVILRPYAAASNGNSTSSQNQMTSFFVASSDPDNYGELRTYVMPTSRLPDGPNLAADGIQSDDVVAGLRRDLCQGKSVCDLPTPVIIPVDNSLLYVQSFFVAGTDVGAPKLENVIVSYQSGDDTRIAVASTFREALVKIFGADDVPEGIEDTKVVGSSAGNGDGIDDPVETDGSTTTTTTTPKGSTSGTISAQEAALIDKIVAAFDAADDAARSGDQVLYAQKIKEADGYADDLAALRKKDTGSSGSGSSSSSTTTTTKPSSGTSGSGGSSTTTTPKTTTTSSAGA
ncbi:UPF0182 family protein [Aquihabitans sp. G128]|uniref:UPF0182 family membrane protein n=1 Tax=Aquihabitans sp. G128 TaxID=2849779 RepID=UPI001C21316A|nr:UPF0182 family protein [Aquihabitans sp. G128]QXC60472.1 UPF0182 family protein [Aquihabitans sp. G128]